KILDGLPAFAQRAQSGIDIEPDQRSLFVEIDTAAEIGVIGPRVVKHLSRYRRILQGTPCPAGFMIQGRGFAREGIEKLPRRREPAARREDFAQIFREPLVYPEQVAL